MNAVAERLQTRRPTLLVPPRQLVTAHRWLGIGVGFMFVLWFASGVVLCFVPFPSLSERAQIAHAEWIDFHRVRIGPAAAMAAAPGLPIERIRLISVAGHPRYVLSLAEGPVASVSAESGKLLGPLPAATALAAVGSFSTRPPTAISGPLNDDQWTVHDKYDAFRPLYRIDLADSSGTQLYVSARSGEVLQRTTRGERAWNRVGGVIHWINIVALRRHKNLWRCVMLAGAGACGLLALAGLALGIVQFINARRSRRGGLSPFRGWRRLHHVVGLFAWALLLSWVVSGFIMMIDDGFVFPSDDPTAAETARVQGMSLAEAAAHFPVALFRQLPQARQLEVIGLAGRPYLIVLNGVASSSWVATPATGGLALFHAFPDQTLLAAVRAAWPSSPAPRISPVAADDTYAAVSGMGVDGLRRISLGDSKGTWIGIDSATGRLLAITNSVSRTRRWFTTGLHDFYFPQLVGRPLLRRALIALAASIGLLFSCTGIVLGVKRLARGLT